MVVVSRHAPDTAPEEYYRGLLAGQSYLHSLGVTGWQDAIVGDYAGMDDAGPTYLLAAQRGELTAARRRCAVVGPRPGRGAGRVAGRAAGGVHPRPVPGDQRQGDAGRRRRELHGRADLAVPRPLTATRPTNSGHSFVDPQALKRTSPGSTPRASRCTSTASATAGYARRWTRSRRSTTPARGRHHIAHLQLVHPDDVRRFADLGVAANVQTLWACLDDQMIDLTLPFLGRGAGPLAVPVRRPPSLRRPPRRRQRLAGQHAQPARGDPRRGQPLGLRRGGPGGQRALPARAGTRPRDGVRGVHERVGLGEPPRRRRHHRARAGGRPRRPRPRPVRRGPGEIGATQVVSTWVDGVAVHQA